jgi:hypothetical protein
VTPDAAVALALDAFIAEHRQCWRTGEGLETGDCGPGAVWLGCPTCGASLTIPRSQPEVN